MLSLKSTAFQTSFIYKFLQKPQKIGSVIPSSCFLVEKMTEKINWELADIIVELGAGTGVITKTIASRKKESASVIVAEQDAELHTALKNTYPEFLHIRNAADFVKPIKLGNKKADYVICSLPFSIWPKHVTEKYLGDIAENLADSGELIIFQYSPYIYKSLKKFFPTVKISFTLLNLPPAIVYRCKKHSR